MARPKNTEQPSSPLEALQQLKGEAPAAEITPQALTKVKVVAKHPPFLDLITDTWITGEPIEMEVHPHLQLQIDAGKVLIV